MAILYALITLYLFDYHLVQQTWFGNFPISYKFSLMIALLQGFQTLFSPFDLFLLLITALLVGINFMLALSNIQKIKQKGKLSLSLGGASIIGLAATGCTTCGLSLFALFGLSAAVSSLPFHGLELHIVALVLLLLSLGYMIKKLHEEVYCIILPLHENRK
ncbi:MAG TPA: hypothetical protein VLG12_00395 [Candidatus Saccharimonadales bacterium]|nr:hypothetical protein [Candidatus Saccharimonadales bacterium]